MSNDIVPNNSQNNQAIRKMQDSITKNVEEELSKPEVQQEVAREFLKGVAYGMGKKTGEHLEF